jgi:WD40 repeat protein
MKYIGMVLTGALACLLGVSVGDATDIISPVTLPGEGTIVGSAFSPHNSRLAVMRNVAIPGASARRHVLQIIELESRREIVHADVLEDEASNLASNMHFVEYSSDGRYLLLATKGSDILSIIDAASLKTIRQIALHPDVQSRTSLGETHLYFRGVVSVAVSSEGGSFGALTHDELKDNEVFLGSFSSGKIIQSWGLGRGRTATELGQTSLSLADDGLRTVVSVLPERNTLPKGFNNLRLYDSRSGEMLKSIRTGDLVGQVMLLPGDTILASKSGTPGFFSKKTCVEEWSFRSGTLVSQFCDPGRNVLVALAASLATGRVVGFACKLRNSIEGGVYAASGRVDVWDLKTGSLIASSAEIPRLVSSVQMSANGEWIMADQMLLQLTFP